MSVTYGSDGRGLVMKAELGLGRQLSFGGEIAAEYYIRRGQGKRMCWPLLLSSAPSRERSFRHSAL